MTTEDTLKDVSSKIKAFDIEFESFKLRTKMPLTATIRFHQMIAFVDKTLKDQGIELDQANKYFIEKWKDVPLLL